MESLDLAVHLAAIYRGLIHFYIQQFNEVYKNRTEEATLVVGDQNSRDREIVQDLR